jgi:transcription elongation factor GreA
LCRAANGRFYDPEGSVQHPPGFFVGNDPLPLRRSTNKEEHEKGMPAVSRPISADGYRKLQEDLDKLVRVERPQVTKEIEIAAAHGDLSENAEYTYAKEKQALIDSRIRDLQDRLTACEVIDLSNRPDNDRIVFGATVTVEDVDSGEQRTLRLLGQDEADIGEGSISVTSPLGKALIGKEEGDVTEVKTPNGLREYEILKVT